jgi:metallo-beta-lactamase family protein
MMDAGRVQHHIEKNISNPYCTLLIIGYCSEGTLGRKLLDGQKEIQVGKQHISVGAKIAYTDAFSGHGDLDDLLWFVGHQSTEKVKGIFLVHGEENAMGEFKQTLHSKGYRHVEMPALGDQYEL